MRLYTLRLCFVSIAALLFTLSSSAQQAVTTKVVGHLVRVTPPLSQIDGSTMYGQPLKITRRGTGFAGGIVDPERGEERVFRYFPNTDKPSTNPTAPVTGPNTPASSIAQNFDGQTATGFAPSDNNLAVGPNHVVQMINHSSGSIFKVWNKSGTVLKASTILSTITGVTGGGDPVVVYDQIADRWVLTEFGFSGGVTSYINTLIIAVSKTPDPTGSYNVYSYNVGSFFVDYPKYSVWQNGYYATSNDFNTAGTSYLGSSAYAFDRAAMIAGNATATMIRTRFTGSGSRYYSMAPVCQEGPTTSNQSGLFAFIQDNAWTGAPTDSIYVFEYTPNFGAGTATVGPFQKMACQLPLNTNTGSLDQPGTTTNLQALNQRLMHKVIYRNFGDHESIVCNATDLANSRTGVHWWELRRPGSGLWSVFQEGLYQPSGDTHNRFMGSIAINGNGDMGLLYNVVSGSVYPSARFTGRNSCDPPGQMTLPETVVMNGTTYEGNNRYGDYNTLSVDPSNGSFWGTAQYNASGFGTYGNWATRIVNFSLSGGCANAGTVSGTSPLCPGQTATYTSNGDPGGSWTSSNTSVATVNASTGLVTAVSAGTTNITYTVSGASAFQTLTVNATPNAGTISGSSNVCTGGTVSLSSNGNAGGAWNSDNTSVATVSASGVVTGVADGTANITYTVTNSCGTATSPGFAVTVAACSTPTVSCPGNVTTSASSGCSTSVSTTNPSISNATTLTWTLSGATTGASGNTGINYVGTANFNIGVTTVTYTASNGTQNATCSFTVTVSDNTAASITCPANIATSINGNRCNANVNNPNPTISDNCTVTKLTWTLSGATTGSSASTGINYVGTRTFNVGITTVTYTVTNGANQTASCSYTVTLRNRKCPGSPAAPDNNEIYTDPSKLVPGAGDLKVTVVPNPTETYFTLTVQSVNNDQVNISVYTMAGKLVQQFKGSASESYRFGNEYSKGVYIAVVTQGMKKTIVRLVK